MQRCWRRFALQAIGLALLTLGGARAAEAPAFTFRTQVKQLDELPGGGTLASEFEMGSLNEAGAMTFTGDVGEGGQGSFLVEPEGKVVVLAKADMESPGGGTFTGGGLSHNFPVNDAGNIALTAQVDRDGDRAGEVLFYDKVANRWTVILKKGMPAPEGGTFTGNDSFAAMNNANEILIPGIVTESTAGAAGTGLFLYSSAGWKTVARPGSKVASGTLTRMYRPQLTNNGIATFEGAVDGAGTFGAYMWRDGVVTELAAAGSAVPGSDATFDNLRGPRANSNGDVVMLGQSEGNWGVYLYKASDKKLSAVVKPGDELPGIGKVVTAEGAGRNSTRIGEDGSILFVATLEDGSEGIFRLKDGQFSTIVKSGREMQGVGTLAHVASPGFGGRISYGLGYNGKGQISFPAVLADDTILIVLATPVAAPATPQ